MINIKGSLEKKKKYRSIRIIYHFIIIIMHRVILTPSQLKKPADAYTNCVFISSKTLSQFSSPPNRYLTIKGLIF